MSITENDSNEQQEETQFRALGFCGADDSVNPRMLGLFSQAYPLVEFGVLFRPDKEGEPRYATMKWVEQLSQVAKKSGGKMKLAAHLCGARVNEVLVGDDAFLIQIARWGFKRVQINATAVNGVDTSKLAETVEPLLTVVTAHPELEFILQKNEETRPLWEALLSSDSEEAGKSGCLPNNVSMLVDESKGTGVLASSWPTPPPEYEIGYAGGIGPLNIEQVLNDVMLAGNGRSIWIDMESSLRSTKNGKDIFDMDKCYHVIDAACKAGIHSHPEYL